MPESTTLHVTEDLNTEQLAELAFTEEIVVMWDQDRGHGPTGLKYYGIITSYDDKTQFFTVAPVVRVVTRSGEDTWRETGDGELPMGRADFVVFGPANREPGDHGQKPHEVAVEVLRSIEGFDQSLSPFLCAFIELTAHQYKYGPNVPAFNVRLDVKHVQAMGTGLFRRNCRISVRATEEPLMHDEITDILAIANKYELAAFHSNVGIEIRRPEDT